MVNVWRILVSSVLLAVTMAQVSLSSTLVLSLNGTNSTTSTTSSVPSTTISLPVTTPSISSNLSSTSSIPSSSTPPPPSSSSSLISTTATLRPSIASISSSTLLLSSSSFISALISSSLIPSSSVISSSETKPTVTTPSIISSPSVISTSPVISSTSTIASSSQNVISTSSTRSRSSAAPSSTPSASRSSASRSSVQETFVYSSVSSSVSFQATVYSTENIIVTTRPDGQTSQRTEVTLIQTSIPALTIYATKVVTSTESPTGIAGLQANNIGSSNNSLSTGAKAGIGAGVAVAVIAAAIFGALFAMRRRRRNNAIPDSDRYTPSLGPSTLGGFGAGKAYSSYTESDMRSSNSPHMRESNPLDRYATPIVASRHTSLPASRISDVSSMSGSEPTAYRPGPGMPAVAETYQSRQETQEGAPADYAGVGSNPFNNRHASGDQTPSLYSHDGDDHNVHPANRQANPAALELSAENSRGYRGLDPEQPYHTRSQLTKPLTQQGRFDVAHNF